VHNTILISKKQVVFLNKSKNNNDLETNDEDFLFLSEFVKE